MSPLDWPCGPTKPYTLGESTAMPIINFANREIMSKVIYFGASRTGCATNVRRLHKLYQPAEVSYLHHFGERDSQCSWFFELLPESSAVAGFTMRFRLYSLTSGITHQVQRQEIVKGVDAVVFVADARPEMTDHNVEGMLDLEKLLSAQGLELAAIPIVLQVNHCDAPNALLPDAVVMDINPYGFPVVEAVAPEDRGIRETLEVIVNSISARVRDNMAGNEAAIRLTAVHRPERIEAEEVLRQYIERMRKSGAVVTSSLDEKPVKDEYLFANLPDGPIQEVHFDAEGLEGHRPVHIIDAQATQGTIKLSVVFDRTTGGGPQRLNLVLKSRHPQLPSKKSRAPDLPDPISLPSTPPPPTQDLPGVVYGIAGVIGGIIVGALLAFLFFA